MGTDPQVRRGSVVARKVVTYAATATLAALFTYILIVGEPILLPFVIAIFAWYLITAVSAKFARIEIGGRRVPASLRRVMAIVVLLAGVWLIVHLVVSNVGTLVETAPTYEQNLVRRANKYAGLLGMDEVSDLRALFANLDLSDTIRNLTLGLTSVVAMLGTVAIYTVFLLVEQKNFPKKIAGLFPEADGRALVHRILERIGKEIQTYVWLKTLISGGTAFASYLVMKFLGLHLAAFWAVLIFGLNFIPYIGSWLGVLFPATMALAQYETLTPLLLVVGGLSITQFTGGSIVEPRIMGTGLNVSPVVMLLALAFWGNIWGIVGMFLAVPMTVVMMIICSHIPSARPIAILLSADGEVRQG